MSNVKLLLMVCSPTNGRTIILCLSIVLQPLLVLAVGRCQVGGDTARTDWRMMARIVLIRKVAELKFKVYSVIEESGTSRLADSLSREEGRLFRRDTWPHDRLSGLVAALFSPSWRTRRCWANASKRPSLWNKTLKFNGSSRTSLSADSAEFEPKTDMTILGVEWIIEKWKIQYCGN